MGKIVTFYSYKGGTGRSMALANVAYLLAQWGYSVLVVDWDLEAPGLEHFYSCLVDVNKISQKPGVIDILGEFQKSGQPSESDTPYWKTLVTSVPLNEPERKLDILVAGNKQDPEYSSKVRELDVSALYSRHEGGAAIEALRNEWKAAYDLVLVDSRTGVTDIGGICTIQLPDMLVLLAIATDQSLDGIVDIARRADAAQKELLADRLRLVAIPVPSRFDSSEHKLHEKWLTKDFAEKLTPVYSNWLPTSVEPIEMLRATIIPYLSYFGFGEKLAAIEQDSGTSGGLTYAYENLAALIALDLESAEDLVNYRDEFVERASRLPQRRRKTKPKISISYSHKDETYKDQLVTHLQVLEIELGLEMTVWSDDRIGPGHDWYSQIRDAIAKSNVAVLLISADYLSSDFMRRQELTRLLEREREGHLVILPVLLSPSAWKRVDWLRKLKVLPKDGRPLSTRSESKRDQVYVEIVAAIADVIGQD